MEVGKLYWCYDVDEKTPVQYAGVYVTRWCPEWGEPTVLFREVDDEVQQLAETSSKLFEACKELLSNLVDGWPPEDWDDNHLLMIQATVGDIRQAREAIAAAEEGQ